MLLRPDGITLFPYKEGKCMIWDMTVVHSGTLKYTRLWFYDLSQGSFTKDFCSYGLDQPGPNWWRLEISKHLSSLKGFRIIACQSWCISLIFFKNYIFLFSLHVFIWKQRHLWTLKFFTLWELHQLWQAVILKPFKLEECTLHFWKPPIFINLALAGQGHSCVLKSRKSFVNDPRFIS